MKKIPTLFERIYENHKVVGITENVTPGMEWVLDGEGTATIKWDGSCCAIIDGKFYKRYDAKKGRKAPANAIPCCPPDPVTGHHPHWVPVDKSNPADQWFVSAYENYHFWDNQNESDPIDGTYEAIGPHFQGNPYFLKRDIIRPHGADIIVFLNRSFDGIKEFLLDNEIEGVVFWKNGQPQCKIKRSDFGFEWPVKEAHHDD